MRLDPRDATTRSATFTAACDLIFSGEDGSCVDHVCRDVKFIVNQEQIPHPQPHYFSTMKTLAVEFTKKDYLEDAQKDLVQQID